MQVTVLGSGAAFPRPGGACSGYFLESGDAKIWIDAGNGTFSRLRQRISPHDLDALVLSHDHADHIADVLPLMYELGYDGHVPSAHTLPVYANAAVAPKLLGMVGPGSAKIFETVFEFKPVSQPFDVEGVSFTPFRVVHPAETYGLVITDGTHRLVYTADTATFPALADHCRDADLLICEATFVGDVEQDPGIHMWAREAGELAADCGAKRVLLTHVWASFDPDDAVAEAKASFGGDIGFAVEGETYEL